MESLRWCFLVVLLTCLACQSTELSQPIPSDQSTLSTSEFPEMLSKTRQTLVLMTQRNPTSLSVRWEPVSDAKQYQLLLNGKAVAVTKEVQFTFSKLQPETHYNISVKAQATVGQKRFESFVGKEINLRTGNHQTIPEAFQKKLLSGKDIELSSAYGNVYDDQHKPVSGVQVNCFVFNSSLSDIKLTTYTNNEGFYRFEQLPTDRNLEFTASKPGYASPRFLEVLYPETNPERNRYNFGDESYEYSDENFSNALSLKPDITAVFPESPAIINDFYLRLQFSHPVVRTSVMQNIQLKSYARTSEAVFGAEHFETLWNPDSTTLTLKPSDQTRSQLTPGLYRVTFDAGNQQLLALSGTSRNQRVFRTYGPPGPPLMESRMIELEAPPDVLLTEQQPRLLHIKRLLDESGKKILQPLSFEMLFSHAMSRKSVEDNFQMFLSRDLSKNECNDLPESDKTVEKVLFATASDFDISWQEDNHKAIFKWNPLRNLLPSGSPYKYRYEVNLERGDAKIYNQEGLATQQTSLRKSSLYITETVLYSYFDDEKKPNLLSLERLEAEPGQMRFRLRFSEPMAIASPSGLISAGCNSSPILPENYFVSVGGWKYGHIEPLPEWNNRQWSELGGTVHFDPDQLDYRTVILTAPFQEIFRATGLEKYKLFISTSKKMRAPSGLTMSLNSQSLFL